MKPLDVSDEGLLELAQNTVIERCDGLTTSQRHAEINFMFMRFVRIRDRTRELGNRPVRIWSFEHDAWWRPNSMGYTHRKEEAGLYDRDEAEKIVRSANIACTSDRPNEQMFELDEEPETYDERTAR
jgi:hypothetical protein